jgi:hypothetical protein
VRERGILSYYQTKKGSIKLYILGGEKKVYVDFNM